MNSLDRKTAIAAYKKRERAVGVFSLRCLPTGAVWVGLSTNLDTIWNRLRFTLDHGSHSIRPLQDTWRKLGPDAFAFSVLERIEDDESPRFLDKILKSRAEAWRLELRADAI